MMPNTESAPNLSSLVSLCPENTIDNTKRITAFVTMVNQSEGLAKRLLSGTSTSLRRLVPKSFHPTRKERRGAVECAVLADSQLCPPLHNLQKVSGGSSVMSQQMRDPSSFLSRDSYESQTQEIDFGFQRGFEDKYELLGELGRGGNGVVRVARCRVTGTEFACKSLPKVLLDPNVSEAKRRGHVEAVKREIDVLRRLRGALNVASMQDVYEDDSKVHILMECCTGGELWHAIGQRHYSERTVASYMRAVLRTIAQCHSHHILHRDIKPGNFMLLNNEERAPVKAIDFGLAVLYDPERLPRTDLGLEGTPWYMAPEVLVSKVVPASDVWSAGVMAYQLLTGRFPFDDKNSLQPSIARIWCGSAPDISNAILTGKLDFTRSHFAGISDEAKDFLAKLLSRNPADRPTAKQALQHPWLSGKSSERSIGRSLSLCVVQRIQRFGQSSAFRRSVLEHIAEDLLASRLDGSMDDCEQPQVCRITRDARPVLTCPNDHPLQYLYKALEYEESEVVDRHKVSQGLHRLGYHLEENELDKLLDQVDLGRSGNLTKAGLAASQMDWRFLQENHTDRWLASAKRTFSQWDADGDGVINLNELMACLRSKLPPNEVGAAVEQAIHDAAAAGADRASEGLNFDAFMTLLRTSSTESLEHYDDRSGRSWHGNDRITSMLEKSVRAGDLYMRAAHLDPVAEAA